MLTVFLWHLLKCFFFQESKNVVMRIVVHNWTIFKILEKVNCETKLILTEVITAVHVKCNSRFANLNERVNTFFHIENVKNIGAIFFIILLCFCCWYWCRPDIVAASSTWKPADCFVFAWHDRAMQCMSWLESCGNCMDDKKNWKSYFWKTRIEQDCSSHYIFDILIDTQGALKTCCISKMKIFNWLWLWPLNMILSLILIPKTINTKY